MPRPPRFRTTALLAVVLSLLVSGLVSLPASGEGPSSTGSDAVPTVGVTRVTVTDDAVTVAGAVEEGDGDSPVDLYVIGAESSAGIEGVEAVATVQPGADGRFSHRLPRISGNGDDRLYSQFVAARDGGVIGSGHFADDLQFTSDNPADYPVARDKKGLQVQLTDDAEELGVQHAGINVDLAQIMIKEAVGAADTIEFESGGQTYYFDQSAVSALDTQIKPLSDNGVLVNLIVLLYQHPDEANSAADVLIHPDAVVEPGAGPVYGFNTVTAEGRRYLTAAMEFIASRWSRPDAAHGQAVGYIVGNEVNAQWIWSNSGDKTVQEFVDDHSRAIRLMSLAAKKSFGAARTYLSLEHHWTVEPTPNPDPARPTRTYPARDVIEELNSVTKRTGDFDWFVAQHPYPEDLFDPAFWNDVEATPDPDTKKITFKNIEVLPDYLAREDLTYNGEPRRIILSEQGCNTPGDGSKLTPENEKLQAACYALAYYKIRFLPSIDNFILHRHVDHRQEGGLNLGLWAADYGTDDQAAPLRHKYSYDVFKYIDTSRSLEVTEFAKDIIGINDWSEVVDGFDPEALDQRPIPTEAAVRVDGTAEDSRSLGRFRIGADDWRVSDNAGSAVVEEGALTVTSAPNTFASSWRGVVKDFARPVPVRDRVWLSTSVQIAAEAGLGSEPVVRVKATLASGEIIYGDGTVAADGARHTVALSLAEVPDDARLSRVKIWVRGEGTSKPVATYDIDSVALAKVVTP